MTRRKLWVAEGCGGSRTPARETRRGARSTRQEGGGEVRMWKHLSPVGTAGLLRPSRAAVGALVAVALAGALFAQAAAASPEGIRKIQHVVMIMQANRSFDTYFGTYPGANGIPAAVSVPDPGNGGCVAPYHNPLDENYGGPHGTEAAK